MFVGITVLAHAYQVVPNPVESGMSQLGRAIFGGPNILYYLLQELFGVIGVARSVAFHQSKGMIKFPGVYIKYGIIC